MLTGWESSFSMFAVLGLGLALGFKHATEVDHIIAVSSIVSEHRKLSRSIVVGALWGIGHTASLIIVGVLVLTLRVTVPVLVASWLEFAVALMIIGLGTGALVRSLRRRSDFHLHRHSHDGVSHVHIHFHEVGKEHEGPISEHSHAVSRVTVKPFLVGGMHGLAGSAGVTLLVLTQIESTIVALLYLAVFGLGSIVGMLTMSALIGIPFMITSERFSALHRGLQLSAGALSIVFGIWYAYDTSRASGLWRTIL
jgi:ABC-type nickel/cobalt efflux system permease component RcnA